jgi:hypothetical protein
MLKKPLTEIEITLTEKTMEALQALAQPPPLRLRR